MEQQIRFCTTSDGVRIAYAAVGEGPPLVITPGSWGSLRSDLQDEPASRFYQALAQRHQVVGYDRSGVGLSDRERTELTVDADVRDLEAVAATLGAEPFALMGWFHLGPAAMTYAVRHPERVSRLILFGTYANGNELARDDVKASIIGMMRSHWGMASRTMADMVAPGIGGDALERIAHRQREAASGEMVARLLKLAYRSDVTDLLPSLKTPTLVMHRRGDRAVPFRMARQLATLVPNARLVTLEGNMSFPWFGDADAVLDAIFEFLGDEALTTKQPRDTGGSPLTILFTDITSSTPLTQRLGDAQAQEIRRTHNAIVRGALKAQSGSEIKHTGDGIMASFASASRALECAVSIQRAVAERADPDLQLHIGLNAGEPVAEDADLFGTSVDLARRVCDQAEGGTILASDVVRQLVAGKGFLFADRGAVALRGFEDPVRLYEVRWREEG